MSTPLAPAGWHPDPTGRYEYRYFNGHQWTADVSVHGARFIDSGGPPTWQPGWGPEPPSTSRRTRGMAIAAFVVGLVSLLLAWIPFIFVLGGAGAITALVLGIIGVRRAARNEGYGQGYAVAGIVLSVVALGLCVAGFFFTRFVLREVDSYLDPGPHGDPVITTCLMSTDTGLHMTGTILNEDSKPHRYEISMEYRFSDGTTESEVISVPSVPSGQVGEFTSHLTVVKTGTVACKVTSVYGPTPFGASAG